MWSAIKGGVVICLALLPLYFIIFTSPNESFELKSEPKISLVLAPSISSALALWQQGQYQESISTLSAINQPLGDAGFYQFYFDAFLNRHIDKNFTNQPPLPQTCAQQLLFVTGEAKSLAQAEKFKQQFFEDQRLQSLSICIQPLIWFNPEVVQCASTTEGNNRISCDLSLLANELKSQQFTHLVVFTDIGKANVHNGIMYLDQQDTYDVFVHELAHFSGFVDEYPLSKDMASVMCDGEDAPNLVFGNRDNNSSQLTAARTCDNHPNQAYKTSKRLTFMEYHDVAYIPPQYLTAWQSSLLEQQNSPSAHVNFAQFYEANNNSQEGQFWRAKYQTYLAH